MYLAHWCPIRSVQNRLLAASWNAYRKTGRGPWTVSRQSCRVVRPCDGFLASSDDTSVLLAAILNPPPPNDELVKLMRGQQ